MTFVVCNSAAHIGAYKNEEEISNEQPTIIKGSSSLLLRNGYYLNKGDIEVQKKNLEKSIGSPRRNPKRISPDELLNFCNSVQEKLNHLPFNVLFFPQYEPPFITNLRDYQIEHKIRWDFDGINKICIDFLEKKKKIQEFSGGFYFLFDLFDDFGNKVQKRFIVEHDFVEVNLPSLENFICNILRDNILLNKDP